MTKDLLDNIASLRRMAKEGMKENYTNMGVWVNRHIIPICDALNAETIRANKAEDQVRELRAELERLK